MSVTAVTIARKFVHKELPVPRVQINSRAFTSALDVQRAWFDALELVGTKFFFFIDDDDELPADGMDVIAECLDAPLTYTNEIVNGVVRVSGEYTREAHIRNPLLLHNLVVCNTRLAKQAIANSPRGHYWPEMLIYWQVARAGIRYVPRVGYVWNKKQTGLHKAPWTAPAIVRSALWCKSNP